MKKESNLAIFLGLGSSLARKIEILKERGLDRVISNLHTSPSCKLFSLVNKFQPALTMELLFA